MEQVLLRQQELLHVWGGCLERLLQPDEPDADARGWPPGPQVVETQYNGLLRRLWGTSEVPPCTASRAT